jgi:hypothetical protein
MRQPTFQRALSVVALTAMAATTGCMVAAQEDDGPEPIGQDSDALSGGSVEHAMQTTCSTSSVKGLSKQIIAEARCINANAYAKLPARKNLHLGSAVFPYLEKPARDRLVSALDAHPSKHLHIESMLRTVAQQYLLYRWDLSNRCGIPIAATPGNSNHETGLAFDTSDYGSWKSILQSKGFRWYGTADDYHFDYVGSGASDHRGLDVKAFQRLWNRNHPNDKITVDGDWGPQTEARMKKAPANGFAKGAICGG